MNLISVTKLKASLDELGHHPVVKETLENRMGLILVAGEAGHGKSPTVAAMVDHINENQAHHILTVEDPIEFVHPKSRCLITQREVGVHTHSVVNALQRATREDPDIIVVGEMHDSETISLALTCASLGVLVFGTHHTNNAAKTIDRLVDAFPANEILLGSSALANLIREGKDFTGSFSDTDRHIHGNADYGSRAHEIDRRRKNNQGSGLREGNR